MLAWADASAVGVLLLRCVMVFSAIVIFSEGGARLRCRHVTVSYLVRRPESSYLLPFFPGFSAIFSFPKIHAFECEIAWIFVGETR